MYRLWTNSIREGALLIEGLPQSFSFLITRAISGDKTLYSITENIHLCELQFWRSSIPCMALRRKPAIMPPFSSTRCSAHVQFLGEKRGVLRVSSFSEPCRVWSYMYMYIIDFSSQRIYVCMPIGNAFVGNEGKYFLNRIEIVADLGESKKYTTKMPDML